METHTNNFKIWIEDIGGARALSVKLGVHESTVSHWLRGLGWPRVKQVRKIKRLAKGRLTYEDIIDGCKI